MQFIVSGLKVLIIMKMKKQNSMFTMMSKREAEAMAIAPDCPMCEFFPAQPYYYYQKVVGGPIFVEKAST